MNNFPRYSVQELERLEARMKLSAEDTLHWDDITKRAQALGDDFLGRQELFWQEHRFYARTDNVPLKYRLMGSLGLAHECIAAHLPNIDDNQRFINLSEADSWYELADETAQMYTRCSFFEIRACKGAEFFAGLAGRARDAQRYKSKAEHLAYLVFGGPVHFLDRSVLPILKALGEWGPEEFVSIIKDKNEMLAALREILEDLKSAPSGFQYVYKKLGTQ